MDETFKTLAWMIAIVIVGLILVPIQILIEDVNISLMLLIIGFVLAAISTALLVRLLRRLSQ